MGKRTTTADVLNFRSGGILLKKAAAGAGVGGAVPKQPAPSGHCGRRLRDQLGEFAQVLGGGGEEELVMGAAGASQSQSVKLQDPFEVGEQHLDLLSLAA